MPLAWQVRARVLSCCLATLVPLIAAPPSASGASRLSGLVHPLSSTGVATNQSSNWSGYNIGIDYPGIPVGTTFTSVTGKWTVPTATQHKSGESEASASWVGIGGGCVTDDCSVTDNTLIQAGTEQDVNAAGKAKYGTWWEIIPEPQTPTPLAVAPGETVTVKISETSSGEWSILIKNVTTGLSFSTSTPYSSSMDTAEWIEETPLEIGTGGTGVSAMPNLGTVHFRKGTLNGANPDYQTIDEMQLSSNGKILATPSGPSSTLNAFNDCTFATTCPAP